jgi:hypothetical protein
MEHFYGRRKFARNATKFLLGAALATATPVFANGVLIGDSAETSSAATCTFSDGGTIAFGHETWRTGEYEAIPFRISERMVIPPF